MTKINSFWCKWMLIPSLMLVASCNSDLKDDVDDLKDRVAKVEASVADLQQAVESGKLITAVNPIAATSDMPAGWEIVFSGDGGSIKVYNGAKGETGATGSQGPQGGTGAQGPAGVDGKTPYVWVNAAGNWAMNVGSKPTDSDNAKYEMKDAANKSIPATGDKGDDGDKGDKGDEGISMKVINKDGYIAFQQYYKSTGVSVGDPIATNFPFDGGMIITAVVETEQSVTFTIDDKEYVLAKAIVYPGSITVLYNEAYIIKGSTVTFKIAVNPTTNKTYTKEAFSLDFEEDYAATRAYGNLPDFVSIKDVQPVEGIAGQYNVTLAWTNDIVKDAAIFVVLNFTDTQGKSAYVVSSTPVIVNEKYQTIKAADVAQIPDFEFFNDEHYNDTVRLVDYHPGYVNKVEYSYAQTGIFNLHHVYASIYRFEIEPLYNSTTVSNPWGATEKMRAGTFTYKVTDKGVAEIPAVPADPTIGKPGVDAVPGIAPVTITKTVNVKIFNAPEFLVNKDYQAIWLPAFGSKTALSTALNTELPAWGYDPAKWTITVESETLSKGTTAVDWATNKTVERSATGFDAAGNYTLTYNVLPTADVTTTQQFTVVTTFKAVAKAPRAGKGASTKAISDARTFKMKFVFTVAAPQFMVYTIPDFSDSGIYKTYDLSDIPMTSLFTVAGNAMTSLSTDITPNAALPTYTFADNAEGANGLKFNPATKVTGPAVAEWGTTAFIQRPIEVYVELKSGQKIPVMTSCTAGGHKHLGKLTVQYDRLDLDHILATNVTFTGDYTNMQTTGIDISGNFKGQNVANVDLHSTMIAKVEYSAQSNVLCDQTLPVELRDTKVLQIDPVTGVITAVSPAITWTPINLALSQVFRVKMTDIWGHSATKDITVNFTY